jgi:hypothetical protein
MEVLKSDAKVSVLVVTAGRHALHHGGWVGDRHRSLTSV